MSSTTVEQEPARPTFPIAMWSFAVALLVAEYVLAIFLFDAERLPIAGRTEAFRYLGLSMPLLIVGVSAALLVGIPPESEQREIAAAFREPRRTWPIFVAQLIAYAVALAITIFVFNRGIELSRPWVWIGLWAGSAICALLLWIAAVVPPVAVKPLRRPVIRALAVGLVVGVIALLAGASTSVLWRPMSMLTLDVVAFLLDLTGHEVIYLPEELVVGTPAYEVFVDRPCSGYEGIGLIIVMLGFYLFYFRKSLRFSNALILVPIGIVLIWIANSVRIAALIGVGTWISPEIAEGGFHSAAGWLLFCMITLGLVAVSRQSGWFARDAAPRGRGSFRTPEGAYLLPLLFLIAAALVTGLFTSDFDYLYPVRILAPLIPLWLFRSYYRELRWSWSWTPIVLGVVVLVLWVALEPEPAPEATATIPNALAEMPRAAALLWLVARVFGSTIVVPIAEELAFRGYLLRRLIDADFTAVSPKQFTLFSFLVSSIAFGALHGRWLAGILAGMIYAAAQYRRGQISDAIVAHAVTNGLLAAYVLIFGHWAFW
jgi:exosortase E/protease (VPEID-CTERM system)